MVENVIIPRCSLCKSENTSDNRCSSCKVARYCTKEHQTSDWAAHKAVCTPIKHARAKLEKEELELRNDAGSGIFSPPYPFENNVGHFWGILSTRDYMRARIDYVIKVLKVDTYDAVSTGLECLRDMLHLCRSDNLGARDMIPGCYLRLEQDQKCYDFIKWYATEGSRSDYSYGNMSLPFLNLENEDVMEGVEVFCGEWKGADYGIPIALIKVRMLLDLRDLRASSALLETDKLNFDTVQRIRSKLHSRSSIWSAWPDLLSIESERLDDRIKMLGDQTEQLFKAVWKANKYFWEAIIDPRPFGEIPSTYSQGSVEETAILLLNHLKSWEETDGAWAWVLNMSLTHI